jgi:hypothetical protein
VTSAAHYLAEQARFQGVPAIAAAFTDGDA